MARIAQEHTEVLKTLHESGMISRQAMKSIRGQVISLKTHRERESYLKKIIKGHGGR